MRPFAAIITALLLAVPATAFGAGSSPGSRDRGTRLGTTVGGIVSDGNRYAVTKPSGGTLQVLDRRRMTRRDLFSTCTLSGMAERGPALLLCRTEAGLLEARLLNPATRQIRSLPGSAPTVLYQEIGRRWMQASSSCPDGGARCIHLRDWRTGDERIVPDTDNRHRSFDLDSADPQALPADFNQSNFRRRRGVIVRTSTGSSSTLVLQRGSRVTRIGSCRPLACLGLQLGTRYATWSAGDTAYAYDLRSKRRRSWKSPARTDVRYMGVPVAQTASSLIVGFELKPDLLEDSGARVVRAFELPG